MVIKLSNACLAETHYLSTMSRNPTRALSAMRRITRQTVRLLKAESVVDMFEKLNSKKIPLRSVQLQSKKMCTGLQQARVEELAHKVMNWKYADAKNTLREEKKRNTREKREAIRILTECAPQQIPAFTKTLEEEKKISKNSTSKEKEEESRISQQKIWNERKKQRDGNRCQWDNNQRRTST